MERGIEFTTFSVIGRCERTGMLGVAIATSEMAVGSRCIHVAPGVGAVVCQASTNPRLGFLGLNLMRAGYSAPRALEAGKRAGGQPDGEQSAGLYVVDREPFAVVDLRVDLHPEPVRELRRFADRYFPLIPYYSLRPFDPDLPRADDWLREHRH